MTTDKRKAQYREATKNNYTDRKNNGWIRISVWIKPEKKVEILNYIKGLK